MSVSFTQPKVAIALGAGTLFTVLLLSHGAFIVLVKRWTSRRPGYETVKSLYEDSDGKATEESQQRYIASNFARTLALLATIAGLGTSIAATVIQAHGGTSVIVHDAVRTGCWSLLSVQAVVTFTEHKPLVRFRSGGLAMISAFIILLELALVYMLCTQWQKPTEDVDKVSLIICASQAILALISGVAFACIPRRPAVYTKDGDSVDAEFTVSVLSRLTFAWAFPLLVYARRHKTITLEEIPHLADYTRADTLQRTYNANKKQGRRLWLQLIVYLRWAFIKQLILISIVSVTQFLPQYTMFKLLNLLEQRSPGAAVASEAWLWVLGLFLAMILSSWIEAFVSLALCIVESAGILIEVAALLDGDGPDCSALPIASQCTCFPEKYGAQRCEGGRGCQEGAE